MVSSAVLDQAKQILGVGDADGKIDRIRSTLTKTTPEDDTPVEAPAVDTTVVE
jgi:hypothetical protein